MCLIDIQGEQGQSPKECNSAPKSTIQHFWSAEWYSWVLIALLCFGVFWTPFLGFLELDLALRCVFNPYSKTFISFLNNPSLFRNNYLVDKYPKINLINSDYPQFYCYPIIPFIPMQAILFQTLIVNQSQNYLINFNCLTNQN